MSTFNEKTLIPLSLVIALAGLVFSFGVIYQRVESVVESQTRIENRIARIEAILLKPIALANHYDLKP